MQDIYTTGEGQTPKHIYRSRYAQPTRANDPKLRGNTDRMAARYPGLRRWRRSQGSLRADSCLHMETAGDALWDASTDFRIQRRGGRGTRPVGCWVTKSRTMITRVSCAPGLPVVREEWAQLAAISPAQVGQTALG